MKKITSYFNKSVISAAVALAFGLLASMTPAVLQAANYQIFHWSADVPYFVYGDTHYEVCDRLCISLDADSPEAWYLEPNINGITLKNQCSCRYYSVPQDKTISVGVFGIRSAEEPTSCSENQLWLPSLSKCEDMPTECEYGLNPIPALARECSPPPRGCKNPMEGNPVEIATGRKSQVFTDYNSDNVAVERRVYVGKDGARWTFSFQETAIIGSVMDRRYVHIDDGTLSRYLIEESETCWRYPGGDDCYRVAESVGGLSITLDGVTKHFDSEGRLVRREEQAGPVKTINYQYDANVVSISARNETIDLEMNASGNVSRLKQQSGDTEYQYSPHNGLLEKVIFPDQSFEEYVYTDAAPFFLKELRHEGEVFAKWDYDDLGRVVHSWHAGGYDSTRFEYFDDEVLVTNALGKGARYFFSTVDGVKLVTQVQGEPSANCAAANKKYEYYENGTIESKTDWKGNMTTYLRDDLGREISRIEAAGTPEARTITTEYHATLNKPVKITEPGKVTTMTYDAEGRLISNTTQSTTAP